MSDPKRWLEEGGGATFEERELLRAGRGARMPTELRKRVWLGVAASSAGLGATADALGGALQKGSTVEGSLAALSGPAAKGIVALALVGGAVWGVSALRSVPEARVRAVEGNMAPAAQIARPRIVEPTPIEKPIDDFRWPEPSRRSGSRPITHEVQSPVPGEPSNAANGGQSRPRDLGTEASKVEVAGRVRPSISGAGSKHASAAPKPAGDGEAPSGEPMPESRAASRLREESATVLAIRKALLAGEPVQALRMLERARADFPDGALAEEREALAVRALAMSGQKEAARKRGNAFLRAFPRSPHAAELRTLLGP